MLDQMCRLSEVKDCSVLYLLSIFITCKNINYELKYCSKIFSQVHIIPWGSMEDTRIVGRLQDIFFFLLLWKVDGRKGIEPFTSPPTSPSLTHNFPSLHLNDLKFVACLRVNTHSQVHFERLSQLIFFFFFCFASWPTNRETVSKAVVAFDASIASCRERCR